MDKAFNTSVLFNGQGDYVQEYRCSIRDLDYRDSIPPGCFVRQVSPEQLEVLKAGKAQMRADGTLYMRK